MPAPDGATVRLAPRQTAVIGYGSLMSRASLSKTLRRPYEGVFAQCHVLGWRRSWDVSMPNEAFYYRDHGAAVYPERIVYLNVRPSPGGLMNAVLFVVDEAELAAMHAREWIYDPVVVTESVRGVTVEGGDAVMYVGRPEHRVGDTGPRRVTAIRASYLRILDDALADVDAIFRDEFRATSEAVPAHLVIDDALDPERPNPWTPGSLRRAER